MVYFAALAVMTILLGFGLTYMYMTRTQIRISNNETDTMKAFYLAEAGAEYSLAELICGFNDCASGYPDEEELTDGTESVDLDEDFNPDLEAHYDSTYTDPGEIKGRGWISNLFWAVEAKVNASGIYGAVVSGGWLYLHNLMGVINGNIDGTDYGPGIDIPLTLIVYGTVTENNNTTFSATIPEADFGAYKTLVEAQALPDPEYYQSWVLPADSKYSDFVDGPNLPLATTGMYFVEGNFTIDEPGFTLNGTLIVDGNLVIETDADGITITGSAGHPALVVHYLSAAVDVDGTQLDTVNLGMVYARDSLSITSCDNLTINGALVARAEGYTTEISWGNNFTVNYDPELTLDAGYFSGGTYGYPKIVLWQGHEDVVE